MVTNGQLQVTMQPDLDDTRAVWALGSFWLFVVIAGLVAWRLAPAPRPNSRLPVWRAVAAGAFGLAVIGTTILGRIDTNLQVCRTTTVKKTIQTRPVDTVIESSRSCDPPLDIAHAGLLMLVEVALLAPVLSEIGIPGLLTAKIRDVAAQEAARTTTAGLSTLELGAGFRAALREAESGDNLGDLPDE